MVYNSKESSASTHICILPSRYNLSLIHIFSDEDYLFMKEFVANAVYDDYDRLVQLCDALAMPSGFCLLDVYKRQSTDLPSAFFI